MCLLAREETHRPSSQAKSLDLLLSAVRSRRLSKTNIEIVFSNLGIC